MDFNDINKAESRAFLGLSVHPELVGKKMERIPRVRGSKHDTTFVDEAKLFYPARLEYSKEWLEIAEDFKRWYSEKLRNSI
ncbi:hypothetical protein GBO34_00775 [Roseivirga pacifica]|uniref:hypothetical protein n=1 Tax=Roseivirga pacifica TaxID=1267423 RepID=UPI0020960A6C|nr:hypothetical protein [Roseivirga pacifica]MCO6367846.1 hypothetical protein [Roseivirga pacifica]MCO6377218.1 hypothetical protein [Roseivirga pacifica]